MKKSYIVLFLLHLQPIQAQWHTIFAHGIVDGPTQIQRFAGAISTSETTAIEFADTAKAITWDLNGLIGSACYAFLGKNVNRKKMYMGQGADIAELDKVISQKKSTDKIILYGCSRGATAIINYMAKFNPSTVKALVFDSACADMPSTLCPILAKLGIHPKYASSVFTKLFPAYRKNSMSPIEAIKHIHNKSLPIFLIHSMIDATVPYQHSCKLYQEFKKQGFLHVHLIILPEGKHSFLLQNTNTQATYLQAIHAFYKKYSLPYNTTYNQKSDFNFTQLEQNLTEINSILESYDQAILQTYQNSYKRNVLLTVTISTVVIAYFNRHKF